MIVDDPVIRVGALSDAPVFKLCVPLNVIFDPVEVNAPECEPPPARTMPPTPLVPVTATRPLLFTGTLMVMSVAPVLRLSAPLANEPVVSVASEIVPDPLRLASAFA